MNRLIIGCGYLGRRIATIWKNQGDRVFLITRNENRAREFESQNFFPLLADITQRKSLQALNDLPELDTLLFAVGMDRSRYQTVREVYVDGLNNVIESINDTNKIDHWIHISSTGVYGDSGGEWIDETSPTNPQREGGIACLEAEHLLKASRVGKQSTILRFAGIYGPDRIPTRSTIEQRKWNRLSSAGFVNLIHVDDGASITARIADSSSEKQGEVFCVSDGQPPRRRDYYQFIASLLGVETIQWNEDPPDPSRRAGSNKRVSNQKLVHTFGVKFQYPDYRLGIQHAMSADSS